MKDRRLAVDIGNTRTKFAVFKGTVLEHTDQIKHLSLRLLQDLVLQFGISYVIISSVRHLAKNMTFFIDKDPRFFLLTHNMRFPFQVAYKTPETLGLDRLASVAGAWAIFPNQNSMVVDAGTCIKYEIITKDGIYRGGNIAPGLRMRLEAMHLLTSKLPHVEPFERYETMGTDTTSALQVGACTGAIHEVQGFMTEYKKTFSKLNILLTGGDSHFFVNNLKTKIFEAPNLVLQGLNEILDYNVQKI
ncbi:MAG: type III pantothenate kinase [Saprospiraceae bacterium]|nr:type III pantothenate kinase [Saprospiraceae bacterium]